jgi:hypothetical protein
MQVTAPQGPVAAPAVAAQHSYSTQPLHMPLAQHDGAGLANPDAHCLAGALH